MSSVVCVFDYTLHLDDRYIIAHFGWMDLCLHQIDRGRFCVQNSLSTMLSAQQTIELHGYGTIFTCDCSKILLYQFLTIFPPPIGFAVPRTYVFIRNCAANYTLYCADYIIPGYSHYSTVEICAGLIMACIMHYLMSMASHFSFFSRLGPEAFPKVSRVTSRSHISESDYSDEYSSRPPSPSNDKAKARIHFFFYNRYLFCALIRLQFE